MTDARPTSRLRRWFSNLRLRQKFSVTALIVAVTAALVVSGVIFSLRLKTLREDQLVDTLAMTQIVAENLQGAVAFEDPAAATVTLASLRAKPLVRGAVVDLPGRPGFAQFGRALPPEHRLAPERTAQFFGWTLVTAAPVPATGDAGGRLSIETDLGPALRSTLLSSLLSMFLAVALAAIIGVVLSFALRGFFLDPIDHLRASTRRVAQDTDYTFRAEVLGRDELGELTMAFNHMLESLQTGDTALRAANRELKETLEERARLEHELSETSRLAGMAQVATGVLHNVGNVLNSVNISSQLLQQSLASNPHLALLEQTAALLRTQGDRVGTFLAEDPRGRLVPQLVIELSTQIAALRQELLREAAQLAENIEHIKQIVAMQQSYAKAGGLAQRVAATELFLEAQRLAQGSLTRHSVEVVRSFSPVPELTTDRHQVLQILVNFITNAVQSVKNAQPAGARRIDLTLTCDHACVRFVVTDNGVGIPADNLQKIFRHGFTTRKDGHGFGLHSGALAAKNLGGQVRAQSEGSGHGARFTLELPVARASDRPPLSH